MPVKPFASYHWRWATGTPSEGLNSPPVYLGVLRVLRAFEGQPPSEPRIGPALAQVKAETGTRLNLERTPERNLIRNSGQYWKALGLLGERDGRIELTPFGNQVASGEVTPLEFSAVTILTLTLPNRTFGDTALWRAAGLSIKPLRLILEVLIAVSQAAPDSAYLTPRELYEVVIPLAGVPGTPPDLMAETVLQRRAGTLRLDGWPDCAPRDNDKRMAGEFLLFLSHYGHLIKIYEEGQRDDIRYYLHRNQIQATADMLGMRVQTITERSIEEVVNAPQIATVERQRRMTSVIARPQQQGFRSRVLRAAEFSCAICGVGVPEVLEAAHIVPVMNNGTDRTDNGLCLRSDLHSLFDSGHLRIKPDGVLILTGTAAEPDNYGGQQLPNRIEIPAHVDVRNLAFRWKYL